MHAGTYNISRRKDNSSLVPIPHDPFVIRGRYQTAAKVLAQIPASELPLEVSFSPDGRFFATGDYEGRVDVYDISQLEEVFPASIKHIATFDKPRKDSGYISGVESIDFTPDSQGLVVCHTSGVYRLISLKRKVGEEYLLPHISGESPAELRLSYTLTGSAQLGSQPMRTFLLSTDSGEDQPTSQAAAVLIAAVG